MRQRWDDELGKHVKPIVHPPGWRMLLANLVEAAGWCWLFCPPAQ